MIFEQQGIPRFSYGFRLLSVPKNLKEFLDPTLDLGVLGASHFDEFRKLFLYSSQRVGSEAGFY